MDYFIKATDEAALWTSLAAAGLAQKSFDPEDPLNVRPQDLSQDQEWVPSGAFTWQHKDCHLDIIGTIYRPTGETQEIDGMTVPVMAALDGFHANLRGELSAEQAGALPLIDKPNNPHRVWAGD